MIAFGYKDEGIKNEENKRSFRSDNKHQSWKTKYPHNFVEKEKCGHIFERDSTPDAERINLRHCSGTGFEYLFDGTRLDVVTGNKYTYIKGGVTETIERGHDSKVLGNRRDLVDGGYHGEVKGNHTMAIGGDSAIAHGGSHTIQAAQNYNIGSGKSVTLISGENKTRVSLDPNGDVTVYGAGNLSINAPNGKLALQGSTVHIAATELQLGFEFLKVPIHHIPQWSVALALGTGKLNPDSKLTTKGEQDGVAQGVFSENQQNVIAGYNTTGTQDG